MSVLVRMPSLLVPKQELGQRGRGVVNLFRHVSRDERRDSGRSALLRMPWLLVPKLSSGNQVTVGLSFRFAIQNDAFSSSCCRRIS